MIAELLKTIDPDEIFVCELSSYQLDDLQYSPHISVIVSLFPEHMNFHGNTAEYYKSKAQLLKNVKGDDYYIYNGKFDELKKWAEKAKCISLPFVDEIPFELYSNLKGEHNKDNIKGAYTVAKVLKIPDEIIEKTINQFKPLPHRLQYVGNFNGISFYDDAISTTPESTIAAIHALQHIGTIFLGGLDRGYDFSPLIPVLKEYNVKNIVLFPESGAEILKLIQSSTGFKPRILETISMEEAVKFAYAHTESGEICLLSTASPSYTIWKNFEEKGDEFQKYVKELANDYEKKLQ
jgi:UDP-N-acetylmuramoylalanine-D-glutamate ligase